MRKKIVQLMFNALSQSQFADSQSLARLVCEARVRRTQSSPFWTANRITFTLAAIESVRVGEPSPLLIQHWLIPFISYLKKKWKVRNPATGRHVLVKNRFIEFARQHRVRLA